MSFPTGFHSGGRADEDSQGKAGSGGGATVTSRAPKWPRTVLKPASPVGATAGWSVRVLEGREYRLVETLGST